MSTLPERMRQAADTLIEANYRFTGCSEAEARQMAEDKWSAVKLRHWADQWEGQDRRQAAIDRAVEVLARDMYDGWSTVKPDSRFHDTWHTTLEVNRETYRGLARVLVESGWTKEAQ